jgi:hypothetical protein
MTRILAMGIKWELVLALIVVMQRPRVSLLFALKHLGSEPHNFLPLAQF